MHLRLNKRPESEHGSLLTYSDYIHMLSMALRLNIVPRRRCLFLHAFSALGCSISYGAGVKLPNASRAQVKEADVASRYKDVRAFFLLLCKV